MEYTAETEQKEREAAEAFAALYRIVARLRAPDGCPWDREQTPLSLRETMVEETYEAVEAVTEGDPAHVREELGDVLLNAVMAAYMYEEQGEFRVADTLTELAAKLVRRHPHVFGGEGYPGPQDAARAATADAVLSQWDAIKRDVEGRKTKGVLDGISAALPPLTRAQKIQKKAAKAGFDFPSMQEVWDKVAEEEQELRANLDPLSAAENPSAAPAGKDRIEEEIGDLLFSVVNLSRRLGVNAGVALARTNEKFLRRFSYVEKALAEKGLTPGAAVLPDMDALWNEAKRKGL